MPLLVASWGAAVSVAEAAPFALSAGQMRSVAVAWFLALDVGLALTIAVPLLAVLLGIWVYFDARVRLDPELAPLVAIAVGGLLLAGSVPGLVALLVADDPVVQGFPTALRIVPGLVAVGVYLYVR